MAFKKVSFEKLHQAGVSRMFCVAGAAAGTLLAFFTILFRVAGQELSDVSRRQHEIVLPPAQLHS